MTEEEKTRRPPTLLLLIRHAMNDWVKSGRLAGRSPHVHLNAQGRQQTQVLAQRLASIPLHAVFASPLERAQETAAPIAQAHELEVQTCPGIGELDFGEWTGRELKELSQGPLWRLVQVRPSAVRFPGGESFLEASHRAVDQVEELAACHPEKTIALVSHADVIKTVVAHYLGMHLDLFQRLVISPASITVLSFTPMGGLVLSVNDTAHLPPGEQEHD